MCCNRHVIRICKFSDLLCFQQSTCHRYIYLYHMNCLISYKWKKVIQGIKILTGGDLYWRSCCKPGPCLYIIYWHGVFEPPGSDWLQSLCETKGVIKPKFPVAMYNYLKIITCCLS